MTGLQLWAGHECTVNRVGDSFFDQTVMSGHHDRIGDLDRFASLGVSALRYPVLWERVAPDTAPDWRWSDQRLARIADLGMRPIVGLLHHGSGPASTNLLDPAFPARFAQYAEKVAERYPWITDWTPINEPLTTARFSALYGHWYPHARHPRAFVRALLNQIDATRLAMRAIRRHVPNARLVQTEDLGQTFATPKLTYQAEFENERRWLTWDLLSGQVDRAHPIWAWLAGRGEDVEARLAAIAGDPAPPDVIAVNHYLTSERLLDHRVERYGAHLHGGNGRDRYVDIEAVRALAEGPAGIEDLLDQAWARYGRTIAVTEVHNHCTREEQMRWFHEAWAAALCARMRGADIEAVTAWNLLGGFDWMHLLTRAEGTYESGVYDLRHPQGPRETAMVPLLRSLARGERKLHPVLAVPGWWRRDVRFEYEPVFAGHGAPLRRRWTAAEAQTRPLLVTGATGALGRAVARIAQLRGLPFVLTDRRTLTIEDRAAAEAAIARFEPWAVINCAGWSRIDAAERDEAACHDANTRGAANLAAAAARNGIAFVTLSSDLVFAGDQDRPWTENDTVAPLNALGRSKAAAEEAVLAMHPRALVVRSAALFGAWDARNFAVAVASALAQNREFAAADDLFVSPTYIPDLVNAFLDELIDGTEGVRHLVNPSVQSWAGFATAVAQALDLDPALVVPRPAASFKWVAPRPRYAALGSMHGARLPPLEDAVRRLSQSFRRFGLPTGIALPA
jgi:dTDP-4-dehydrorhamnose reductase